MVSLVLFTERDTHSHTFRKKYAQRSFTEEIRETLVQLSERPTRGVKSTQAVCYVRRFIVEFSAFVTLGSYLHYANNQHKEEMLNAMFLRVIVAAARMKLRKNAKSRRKQKIYEIN